MFKHGQLLSILSLKYMLKWFSKLDAWLEDNIFVISGLISLADATPCEYDLHWVIKLKQKHCMNGSHNEG